MKYSLEFIRFFAVILITFTHTRHDLTEGVSYVIIEVIPKYGTVILSIISGYLYWKVSRKKPELFKRKVSSLLIPYLIANFAVFLPVVIANSFGFDFLNRLNFDYTLFTKGILSLNDAPVNPPTFFIRDIFIVFVLIEMITAKNFKMLFILIPIAFFGELMLRYDILVMFIIGIAYAEYEERYHKYYYLTATLILSVLAIIFFTEYSKYFVSFFIFILLNSYRINFFKAGGYSYLLHLYHSPTIVVSFPIIDKYVNDLYLKIILQILVALSFALFLFILTRKIKPLRIMTGGR